MNKIEHNAPNQNLEIGQFFTRINEDKDRETYIVAKVESKFVLICLDDGDYWSLSAEKITDIFGHSKDEFTLVTLPFTITPDIQ